MNQIEENIVHSFRMAKSDIIQLQNHFLSLSRAQTQMFEMLSQMKKNETLLYKRIVQLESRKKMMVLPVTKKALPRPKKIFVAAKGAKKIHLKNCPFAQNIKPKNKLTFKSKIKPLNEGYKPCKCIK